MAPEVLSALYARTLRVPLRAQPAWECGTLFWEMLLGQHPYPAYPMPGLEPLHYEALAVDRLRAAVSAPTLVDCAVRLVHWDPQQRMSLELALASLQTP